MNDSDDGYYIETIAIGHSVKITAIDPATGIEASIIGPANFTKEQLARQAVKKLRYVLDKRES